MIKFILHGGATGKPAESNNNFFHEAVPDLGRKIKILIIYFARKVEDYPWMFEQDVRAFKLNSPQKDLEMEIADLNPEKFREQIKWADVLYARGGDTVPLVEKFKEIPDLKELLQNKIYAGSSAGMYAMAKYYYSNDRKQIEQGLGILPIKALAHWNALNHWKEGIDDDILEQLEKIGEKLPIYKVKEGEYIIIEQ
jgi:peptidase E